MSSFVFGNLRKDASFISVIMAGGTGTRFWPLSRERFPKQFLNLAPGEQTMLGATIERLGKIQRPNGELMVVTSAKQVELVRKESPSTTVLAEPRGRNTAPCLAFAAAKVLADVGDVPMLCIAADHIVVGDEALCKVYGDALGYVTEHDVIAIFGIAPSSPETGFGYIQRGRTLESKCGSPIFTVQRFVEKPDLDTAIGYLSSGDYYWNACMFAFRPSVYLEALKKYLPEAWSTTERLATALGQPDEDQIIRKSFDEYPSISVDVGVMEKADNAVVFPAKGFHWSDVGSWHTWAESVEYFARESGKHAENILVGDAIEFNCKRSAIWSSKKFVAAIGLEDIVVVETEDAILVCRRDNSQEVKKVVDILRKNGREDLL